MVVANVESRILYGNMSVNILSFNCDNLLAVKVKVYLRYKAYFRNNPVTYRNIPLLLRASNTDY